MLASNKIEVPATGFSSGWELPSVQWARSRLTTIGCSSWWARSRLTNI